MRGLWAVLLAVPALVRAQLAVSVSSSSFTSVYLNDTKSVSYTVSGGAAGTDFDEVRLVMRKLGEFGDIVLASHTPVSESGSFEWHVDVVPELSNRDLNDETIYVQGAMLELTVVPTGGMTVTPNIFTSSNFKISRRGFGFSSISTKVEDNEGQMSTSSYLYVGAPTLFTWSQSYETPLYADMHYSVNDGPLQYIASNASFNDTLDKFVVDWNANDTYLLETLDDLERVYVKFVATPTSMSLEERKYYYRRNATMSKYVYKMEVNLNKPRFETVTTADQSVSIQMGYYSIYSMRVGASFKITDIFKKASIGSWDLHASKVDIYLAAPDGTPLTWSSRQEVPIVEDFVVEENGSPNATLELSLPVRPFAAFETEAEPDSYRVDLIIRPAKSVYGTDKRTHWWDSNSAEYRTKIKIEKYELPVDPEKLFTAGVADNKLYLGLEDLSLNTLTLGLPDSFIDGVQLVQQMSVYLQLGRNPAKLLIDHMDVPNESTVDVLLAPDKLLHLDGQYGRKNFYKVYVEVHGNATLFTVDPQDNLYLLPVQVAFGQTADDLENGGGNGGGGGFPKWLIYVFVAALMCGPATCAHLKRRAAVRNRERQERAETREAEERQAIAGAQSALQKRSAVMQQAAQITAACKEANVVVAGVQQWHYSDRSRLTKGKTFSLETDARAYAKDRQKGFKCNLDFGATVRFTGGDINDVVADSPPCFNISVNDDCFVAVLEGTPCTVKFDNDSARIFHGDREEASLQFDFAANTWRTQGHSSDTQLHAMLNSQCQNTLHVTVGQVPPFGLLLSQVGAWIAALALWRRNDTEETQARETFMQTNLAAVSAQETNLLNSYRGRLLSSLPSICAACSQTASLRVCGVCAHSWCSNCLNQSSCPNNGSHRPLFAPNEIATAEPDGGPEGEQLRIIRAEKQRSQQSAAQVFTQIQGRFEQRRQQLLML
ncbi:MAG: hypothetical protein MHM6MM_003093 [Cercozoa sp. M6MM]